MTPTELKELDDRLLKMPDESRPAVYKTPKEVIDYINKHENDKK